MIWLIGWLACIAIGVTITLLAYSGKIWIPEQTDSLLVAWGIWFVHIISGLALALTGLIGLIGWIISQ